MKIWFGHEEFEDYNDYDINDTPWNQGIDWSDINLWITFDGREPREGYEALRLWKGCSVYIHDAVAYPAKFVDWEEWEGPIVDLYVFLIEELFND